MGTSARTGKSPLHWCSRSPYYYGHARNPALLDGSLGTGVNQSATNLAEYSFSRQTEVYAITDWARGTGAFAADYPGGVNSAGVPANTGRTN